LAGDPELDQLLKERGLDLHDPLPNLMGLGKRSWAVCESIGRLILLRDPETILVRCLPTVDRDCDAVIIRGELERQTSDRMTAAGLVTWRDVIYRSPADLSVQLQLWQRSTERLLAHVVWRAVIIGLSAAPEAPAADAPLSTLAVVARWARAVSDNDSVGEALEFAKSGAAPNDVSACFEAFMSTPLSCLVPENADAEFTDAFERLIGSVRDPRQMTILLARLAPTRAATLAELGRQTNLTRERVRQLQRVAEQALSLELQEPRNRSVAWRASELRRRLGRSHRLDSEAAQAALHHVTQGLPAHRRELATVLLPWLAGPYRLDRATGWLHCGDKSEAGPPMSQAFLDEVTDPSGRIDAGALRDRLSELGFSESAQVDIINAEPRIRQFGEELRFWAGSVLDKAKTILEVHGAPLTADEITAAIDQEYNVRAVRSRLLEDPRFVRTDRTRIALCAWGLEEYSSIVDEISQEIERSGGSAHVQNLVSLISGQFDVTPASVAAYCSAPRFVLTGDTIRLRSADEPYTIDRSVLDEAGCFVLGEHRCGLRLSVDRELLRGSGRPMPAGLAGWLGLHVGGRIEFSSAEGTEVMISWPDTSIVGPTLGSVRQLALDAGGAEGHHALMTFDREHRTIGFETVSPKALESLEGWKAVAVLTGVQADSQSELEIALAAAVGAPDARQLRRRLRSRGDPDIAERLRASDGDDLDGALEQLKGVLS
jgi:Fe2+ transport system protein FeoA